MYRGFAVLLTCLLVIRCIHKLQAKHVPSTSTVDLVSVNGRVTDKQGHDVPGLTANDFFLVHVDGGWSKVRPHYR
jgi:hypothetical protein